MSHLDTKLLHSTAYHPQTDGQTERVNQCLEMYLRCAVHNSPKLWRQWLPLAELWYNSSLHTSLGCSPFKALYGYDPDLGVLSASLLSPNTEAAVVDLIQDREQHLDMLKDQLQIAQNRMKIQADRHRTNRAFQVGEQVLLKLQPYAQHSVVNRPFPKLAFKFFGPYTITERLGSAAYRLDLPEDSKVHNVFHVSQLKAFTPDHTPVFSDVLKLVDLLASSTEPECILDRRLVKKGNTAIPQVLIKWSHFLAEAATWEDLYVVQQRFPASSAWGQVTPEGGEDVMAQP